MREWKRARFVLLLLAGLLLPGMLRAQVILPLPSISGPQDPSQLNAIFNLLINELNAILVPAVGGVTLTAGLTNGLLVTPSTSTANTATSPTVTPLVISVGAGSSTNAGISIDPIGSGNVLLFGTGGLAGVGTNTGVLQFANLGSFVKANGLSPCPGMAVNRPPIIGVGSVVSDFFVVADWMGNLAAVPVCGPSAMGVKGGS